MDSSTTIRRFGIQWKEFSSIPADTESQFREWIRPLTPLDFQGKLVLDAGCGMGRFAMAATRWGAERVVAVDASDAVHSARKNLSSYPNAHVVKADLHHLPFRAGFDLTYCIGVLHHLPSPEEGFQSLCRVVKPGGRVFCWVYGLEGNEWIRRYVDPVRIHLTSRLPRPLLFAVSAFLAILLHPAAKLTRRSPATARVLFKNYVSYLGWLAQYGFRHTLIVIYDHLNPEIAHYLSRSQVESWFRNAGLTDVSIQPRNNNSWSAVATQPETGAST